MTRAVVVTRSVITAIAEEISRRIVSRQVDCARVSYLRRDAERAALARVDVCAAPLHRHKTRLAVLANQIDRGRVICSGTEVPSFGSNSAAVAVRDPLHGLPDGESPGSYALTLR